jgi:hypothetical protein
VRLLAFTRANSKFHTRELSQRLCDVVSTELNSAKRSDGKQNSHSLTNVTMIEPRGITAHLHRREVVAVHNNDEELLVEHDEPERPIHPALEYEILAAQDDPIGLPAQMICRPPRPLSKKLKLFISFFFLVIAGTGNAVAAKLQAIPM